MSFGLHDSLRLEGGQGDGDEVSGLFGAEDAIESKCHGILDTSGEAQHVELKFKKGINSNLLVEVCLPPLGRRESEEFLVGMQRCRVLRFK